MNLSRLQVQNIRISLQILDRWMLRYDLSLQRAKEMMRWACTSQCYTAINIYVKNKGFQCYVVSLALLNIDLFLNI